MCTHTHSCTAPVTKHAHTHTHNTALRWIGLRWVYIRRFLSSTVIIIPVGWDSSHCSRLSRRRKPGKTSCWFLTAAWPQNLDQHKHVAALKRVWLSCSCNHSGSFWYKHLILKQVCWVKCCAPTQSGFRTGTESTLTAFMYFSCVSLSLTWFLHSRYYITALLNYHLLLYDSNTIISYCYSYYIDSIKLLLLYYTIFLLLLYIILFLVLYARWLYADVLYFRLSVLVW